MNYTKQTKIKVVFDTKTNVSITFLIFFLLPDLKDISYICKTKQ